MSLKDFSPQEAKRQEAGVGPERKEASGRGCGRAHFSGTPLPSLPPGSAGLVRFTEKVLFSQNSAKHNFAIFVSSHGWKTTHPASHWASPGVESPFSLLTAVVRTHTG